MGYDTKCYDLAEAFLADEVAINTPEHVDKLAQLIQDTIEGELALWNEEARPVRGLTIHSVIDGGTLGDCVACDGYVIAASEFPHCPTCARLIREGKPL